MEQRNTITLRRSSDCWIAIWSGPHAAAIENLFGTNVIPTGFTPEAERDVVEEEITRLNPGVRVVVA